MWSSNKNVAKCDFNYVDEDTVSFTECEGMLIQQQQHNSKFNNFEKTQLGDYSNEEQSLKKIGVDIYKNQQIESDIDIANIQDPTTHQQQQQQQSHMTKEQLRKQYLNNYQHQHYLSNIHTHHHQHFRKKHLHHLHHHHNNHNNRNHSHSLHDYEASPTQDLKLLYNNLKIEQQEQQQKPQQQTNMKFQEINSYNNDQHQHIQQPSPSTTPNSVSSSMSSNSNLDKPFTLTSLSPLSLTGSSPLSLQYPLPTPVPTPTPPPSHKTAHIARSHVMKKHSNDDLCVICGDKASGYHYNTLSCEGCKGFFRRTITRKLSYQCKYGGNCEMDMWMRRKCPACRLQRCKQVGMREECLLTEHQCIIRNSRRKMKMKKKEIMKNSESLSSNSSSNTTTTNNNNNNNNNTPLNNEDILSLLSEEHKELIERIVHLQDKYELPSSEDLKLVSQEKMYQSKSGSELSDAIFIHMVEMAILVTRLIVEFAKNLPGFRNLVKEDQIILLKASSSEIMMLRTARRYDPETNSVIFAHGTPFTTTSMAFGGLQDIVDKMFEFSKSMSLLMVDNTEYALLVAISIFAERPGLAHPEVVGKLQDVYLDVLISYVEKRRTSEKNYLAKLLMKLVNLRSLGYDHSTTLYNLTLKKGSLPPLLTEYFGICDEK